MQREVEYLQKPGVELKTDFVVGKTRTIGQLMSEDGAVASEIIWARSSLVPLIDNLRHRIF